MCLDTYIDNMYYIWEKREGIYEKVFRKKRH